MGLFDTNSNEIATARLISAKKGINDLRDWLSEMEKEIECHLKEKKGAFPIFWCVTMMDKALQIYNEVARCNGAALVRGTDKK